jgi:hypothetical protein
VVEVPVHERRRPVQLPATRRPAAARDPGNAGWNQRRDCGVPAPPAEQDPLPRNTKRDVGRGNILVWAIAAERLRSVPLELDARMERQSILSPHSGCSAPPRRRGPHSAWWSLDRAKAPAKTRPAMDPPDLDPPT